MTKLPLICKRSFCLHLLVLLTVWGCTYPKSKNRTVLIIDSTYAASFERNQLRLKYMSDEGAPNVLAIEAGLDKIILNTQRDNIELAFQNNNTVTQYFFINHGDSALLTEFEENIGINILNRTCLPFDENYKTKYKASLSEDITGADEFYKACAWMNDIQSDRGQDADLIKYLLKLKKSALDATSRENRFIDSLSDHEQMSIEAAAFFKIKNTFDSLKISHYQGSRPDNSMLTFLEPFKAISQVSSNTLLSWVHFTFYDDWFDTYINRLHPRLSIYQNSQPINDSVRMMIRNLDLKDSLIRNTLLLKVSNLQAKDPPI
jgi:hypothetical protein